MKKNSKKEKIGIAFELFDLLIISKNIFSYNVWLRLGPIETILAGTPITSSIFLT